MKRQGAQSQAPGPAGVQRGDAAQGQSSGLHDAPGGPPVLSTRDSAGVADTDSTVVRLLRERELILNSIGVGLHAVDRDGTIIFANPAAAVLLGWQSEEVLGRPVHALTHHTRADGTEYPAAECPVLATARDGIARHVEGELFWRKDGTSFPADYTSAPIRNESGVLVGAIVSLRDITERKSIERALALNLEQLTRTERLLRARNEELKAFTYTVSHDLKAPLRGIAGYAAELDRNIARA